MSANVETMFYVREKPWHELGTKVAGAVTSAEALKLSGLDWQVEQEPIYLDNSIEIPKYKANVRSTDKSVLGIVGDRYKIVQNDEAFAFTDSLIGKDCKYETAGSLSSGKKVWLLAKMPSAKVAGDEVEPYLCFSNTHDGSGAVRVCMTPVRVVCNNTLNYAFSTAKRTWAMRHTESISSKLAEANQCLELANRYMLGLDEYALQMMNRKVTDSDIKKMLDDLFPINKESSTREIARAKKMKDEFMICYMMPDIRKFAGTAWGVLNAASDFATHNMLHRNTKNYRENNFDKVMTGHPFMDKVAALVSAR